ncbi:hypothetical protein [Brevundimonas sp.]|uniref:hypothetical protein n=1 Tax=Brevundimonas sp. TaxID=1871086 RepID=UPI002B508E38|nr:hypothetical protein [Brevundimonas sp.]HWQ87603.1 hypothetical protein [Brevundimonas sp.]
MKKSIAAALCASLVLGACASSPDNISSQFVSPVLYEGYSCDQIKLDLIRIDSRVTILTGQQRRRASQDAWAVGGALIFWPALFFLMRGDKADELGRLKGEYDALNTVAQQKQCAFQAASAQPAAS